MGLHVDSEVVLILKQSIAHSTLMTLGALGLEVFVALVSLLKHMVAVGTCTILDSCKIKNGVKVDNLTYEQRHTEILYTNIQLL